MLKIIFYIKTEKANKDGLSPIFAKISLNNESISIATGKSITKERWQFTSNLRTVLKIEKQKVIKQALDVFEMNIEKKYNELFKMGEEISLPILRDAIKGTTSTKPKGISITAVMQKHADFFKRKVSAGERAPASLQKYGCAKDLLVAFMKKEYGVADIGAMDINSA